MNRSAKTLDEPRSNFKSALHRSMGIVVLRMQLVRLLVRNLVIVVLGATADMSFLLTKRQSLQFLRLWQFRLMQIQFKGPLSVGHQVYIRNSGNMKLGARCGLGSYARIWNYAPIQIGDDFMAAGGLTFNSATHDPLTLTPIGEPIKIGNRVWCGVNVTILSGVTIGDDVVIGAGSVVTSDIESNCIAVGVPAKKLRSLERNESTAMWQWADPDQTTLSDAD